MEICVCVFVVCSCFHSKSRADSRRIHVIQHRQCRKLFDAWMLVLIFAQQQRRNAYQIEAAQYFRIRSIIWREWMDLRVRRRRLGEALRKAYRQCLQIAFSTLLLHMHADQNEHLLHQRIVMVTGKVSYRYQLTLKWDGFSKLENYRVIRVKRQRNFELALGRGLKRLLRRFYINLSANCFSRKMSDRLCEHACHFLQVRLSFFFVRATSDAFNVLCNCFLAVSFRVVTFMEIIRHTLCTG